MTGGSKELGCRVCGGDLRTDAMFCGECGSAARHPGWASASFDRSTSRARHRAHELTHAAAQGRSRQGGGPTGRRSGPERARPVPAPESETTVRTGNDRLADPVQAPVRRPVFERRPDPEPEPAAGLGAELWLPDLEPRPELEPAWLSEPDPEPEPELELELELEPENGPGVAPVLESESVPPRQTDTGAEAESLPQLEPAWRWGHRDAAAPAPTSSRVPSPEPEAAPSPEPEAAPEPAPSPEPEAAPEPALDSQPDELLRLRQGESPARDEVVTSDTAPRRAVCGSVVARFSTGEIVTLHGTGLIGRNPLPQEGERFDALVRIHDSARSVSKTHLEFIVDAGRLWIRDRFSGNGTILRHPNGTGSRCEAGRRYRVGEGDRVEIGEQFFDIR